MTYTPNLLGVYSIQDAWVRSILGYRSVSLSAKYAIGYRVLGDCSSSLSTPRTARGAPLRVGDSVNDLSVTTRTYLKE
jgi:hypothetical protein